MVSEAEIKEPRSLLLELNKESKGMNARLLVVTLSNGIQAHPHKNERERFKENLGVDDLFYPERRIKAFGDNHRIDVLNLAPLFQVYAEQQNIFLHGFDNQELGFGHWNKTGHALAAEIIADYLCANGAETSW